MRFCALPVERVGSSGVQLPINLLGDFTDLRWLKAKGLFYPVAGGLAGGLLLAAHPTLDDALLLIICAWSYCRAYYILPST